MQTSPIDTCYGYFASRGTHSLYPGRELRPPPSLIYSNHHRAMARVLIHQGGSIAHPCPSITCLYVFGYLLVPQAVLFLVTPRTVTPGGVVTYPSDLQYRFLHLAPIKVRRSSQGIHNASLLGTRLLGACPRTFCRWLSR